MKARERIGALLVSDGGQATVEYLIAGLVMVAMAVGLSALWHFAEDGALVGHASQSASHAIGEMTGGAMGDVLLY